MANVFENLKLLKNDMQDKGWVIESFDFHYKEQNYIVLVKLFEENEKVPEYASVKLEFLKENDFSDMLAVYANSVKLFTDAKTLREYFWIEWSDNLGKILLQFSQNLAGFIPDAIRESRPELEKEAMCRSLSKSDSEDPRKKYCYNVARCRSKKNGELGQRTPFNDNKTRLYRPDLYELLSEDGIVDSNLNFWYSINPDDEKTDEEIILNWTKNKNK